MQPTRFRQNQTPSTLDYVFTEEENVIEAISYDVPLGKSDHVVLTWEMLVATSSVRSTQVKFNYHKGDYQQTIIIGSDRHDLTLSIIDSVRSPI